MASANSSGVVGRYLMDSVGYDVGGYVPALEGMQRHDTDGLGGGHLYMPWWGLDNKNKEFPRGYHVEIGGGYGMPSVGTFHGACEIHEGYGTGPEEVRSPEIWNYRRTIGSRRDDSERSDVHGHRSECG